MVECVQSGIKCPCQHRIRRPFSHTQSRLVDITRTQVDLASSTQYRMLQPLHCIELQYHTGTFQVQYNCLEPCGMGWYGEPWLNYRWVTNSKCMGIHKEPSTKTKKLAHYTRILLDCL